MVLSLAQYSQLCPPTGPCLSPTGAEAPGARHAGRVRIVWWFPPLEMDSEYSQRWHLRFMHQDVYHCVIYNIEKLEVT